MTMKPARQTAAKASEACSKPISVEAVISEATKLGSCPIRMAATRKKPTPKIIARAHEIRSGISCCCTLCMNCDPPSHTLKHYRQFRQHAWMILAIVDDGMIRRVE